LSDCIFNAVFSLFITTFCLLIAVVAVVPAIDNVPAVSVAPTAEGSPAVEGIAAPVEGIAAAVGGIAATVGGIAAAVGVRDAPVVSRYHLCFFLLLMEYMQFLLLFTVYCCAVSLVMLTLLALLKISVLLRDG
jgi:hypothetical protein